MFPAVSTRTSSAPVPSRHSRGGGAGAPLTATTAGRRRLNESRDDGGNTRRGGDGLPHRHAASAAFAAPETEVGVHPPVAHEEEELGGNDGGDAKGGSGRRSLGGKRDSTARALLDDDDLDDELDAAGTGFVGVEGEDTTQSSAGEEAVTPPPAERGGRPESPTGGIADELADGGGEARGDFEATNERQSQESNRWQGQTRQIQPGSAGRGNASHRAARGLVEATDGRFGGPNAADGDNGGAFDLQHGDEDDSNDSGTELTLGRPDPASVHWKFSRRLLQT